jgi:hypothetical protein
MTILNVSSSKIILGTPKRPFAKCFEGLYDSNSFKNLKQFNFLKTVIFLNPYISKIFLLTEFFICDASKFPNLSFS